jgi:hypothetical protein
VQIALPTVAVVADASASAAGLAAHAHVEDRSHRACVPVHSADCVLCQYLNGLATPANGALPAAEIALVATPPARAFVEPRAVELRGLSNPRAPPVRIS